MFHLKALALASVAVVALAGAASAADLLPPPPAMEPPPPIVSADMGGWYLRGDVGVGVTTTANYTSDALVPAGGVNSYYNDSMSEAALFDIGVGYQVNNWFRADITGELRGGSTFEGMQNCASCGGTSVQLYDFYHGHVSSAIGLVNGYIDLGNWYGLTPYVGAGVGLAVNRVSGATDMGANYTANAGFPTGGYFDTASKTNLAWALMAGLDFSVTHNLKLELGYRFLDYGKFSTGSAHCLTGGGGFSPCGFKVASKELYSNDFRIGLRYYLDSPPPPEPGPLVRKY